MLKPLKMADPTEKNVFKVRYDAEGRCIFTIDPNMKLKERTFQSHLLPKILQEHRLLTEAEMSEIKWTHIDNDRHYYIETESAIRPCVYRFSAAKLKELGLIDLMARNRAALLRPGLQSNLQKLMVGANGERFMAKKGTVYEPGISIQPTSGISSYQLSPLARKPDEWNGRELIRDMITIAHKALLYAMPQVLEEGREMRYDALAPLTIGLADNHQITSIQANYTAQDKALQQGIGARFADIHVDMGDNPTLFTLLISYSEFDDDHFGGRMNITPMKLTCPLKPMEILVFSGKFFHCATGMGKYTVPAGSPLRHPPSTFEHVPALPEGTPKMRLNLSIYPTERLFDVKLGKLNPELFTDAALVFRETKLQHHNWMACYFITHEPAIRKYIQERDDLQAKYMLLDLLDNNEDEFNRGFRGAGPQILNEVTLRMKQEFETAKSAARATVEAAGEPPLPPKKVYTKKRKGDYVEDEDETLPRNGRPKFYQLLFGWFDKENSEMQLPDEERIMKSLNAVDRKNLEFEKMLEEMGRLDCGTRLGKNKEQLREEKAAKEAGEPVSDVIWIKGDYKRDFDAEKDIVLT